MSSAKDLRGPLRDWSIFHVTKGSEFGLLSLEMRKLKEDLTSICKNLTVKKTQPGSSQ